MAVHQLGQQRPEFQRGRVTGDCARGGCRDQVGQLEVGDVVGVGGDDKENDAAGLDLLGAVAGQLQCLGEA